MRESVTLPEPSEGLIGGLPGRGLRDSEKRFAMARKYLSTTRTAPSGSSEPTFRARTSASQTSYPGSFAAACCTLTLTVAVTKRGQRSTQASA